jgi:hypothetical protein
LGAFLLLYCILALYGTALLYLDVRRTGCDPSGAIAANDTCRSDGAGVFGAMLGMWDHQLYLMSSMNIVQLSDQKIVLPLYVMKFNFF